MTTVVSQSFPNQVMGEDYGHPIGSYQLDYFNDTVLDDQQQGQLLAGVTFSLYCTGEALNQGEQGACSSVSFFTRRIAQDTGKGNHQSSPSNLSACYTELSFRFEGCEFIGNVEELVVRSMRTWRWA
jgi:hypothetical protein